jgi:hypothetical protein
VFPDETYADLFGPPRVWWRLGFPAPGLPATG